MIVPYGQEVVVSELLAETLALLRIKTKVRTTLELMPMIRRGLPLASLESLAREMDMTTLATAEGIGLIKRTVARRIQEKQTLDPEQSERVVRLARVLAQATAILGSREKARRWLRKQNRALGGGVPLEMLDTDIGAQAVLDELGRIDHGVFA
jgi:putative toxin-antitoxin system antitoxin component (TIGR02293 family)